MLAAGRPRPSELRIAPTRPEAALEGAEPGLQTSPCCPTRVRPSWGDQRGLGLRHSPGLETRHVTCRIAAWALGLVGLPVGGWASLTFHLGPGWGGWSMWGGGR